MMCPEADGAAIHVTVRLFSVLRHREGRIVDRLELTLPAGSRVRDVLTLLQVAEELEAIVAVNGVMATQDDPLADGDTLAIIPAVAGG
ncbi:MAG: hypothetical protein Kow00124_26930 [Anaerolineae bacterium]